LAIEGFLNFYGVYRLGQPAFERRFQGKPLFHKLRLLLDYCDRVQIDSSSEIAKALDVVAKSRNLLVHPVATEVTTGSPPLPHFLDEARSVTNAMETFFSEFKRLVPAGAFLVERGDA
jgi:hypothetical protein